jgi:hypothetical protein
MSGANGAHPPDGARPPALRIVRDDGTDAAPSLAARLRDHLEPGERVLWAARPLPWSAVRDRGLVVPGWLAAIAAPLGAIFASGYGLFLYVGLALLGFAAVVGLLVLAVHRRAGETVHALTDRRILTLSDGAMPKVEAVRADAIAWIEVSPQRDGSGSLHLTLAGKSREHVIAGLPDPREAARRIVTTFGFHAPHILEE